MTVIQSNIFQKYKIIKTFLIMVKLDNKQNLQNLGQNNDSDNYGVVSDVLGSLWSARVVIGIALLAVILRACYSYQQPTEALPGLVSTAEIARNTDDLIGRSVTIRSRPLEQVGNSSFTVRDRRFFGGEPILVINASGQPFNLPANRNLEILVTGEVRNLVIPEVEREFNIGLQDKYYKEYINRPAIIARTITLAPAPGQVTANPSRFYGQRLAVTGEIANIQSPVLFSLDEDRLLGGSNLLVLLNKPPALAINDGQPVAVVGTVRPFVVAEIERDYNITWDLQVKRQLETEYRNRPVFIAEAVYPSD